MAKPEGDVTRQAVEIATLKLGRAKEKLRAILRTGPDNVLMSQREIDKQVAEGGTSLLPYASGQGSPEGVDNALLDQMLASGQINASRGRL